jgi:hypothetical protein
MGLQLIGVVLLAVGLRDTRRAFEDQPTIWQGIKQWWAGRPRLILKPDRLAASDLTTGSVSGTARLREVPGPNSSLDDRVAILERGHAALFDEVGKLTEETKNKINDLSRVISVERNERQEGDRSIKEQLKKAVAEGLPLGRLGAICFFIGIFSASASPEIASWFRGGACPM